MGDTSLRNFPLAGSREGSLCKNSVSRVSRVSLVRFLLEKVKCFHQETVSPNVSRVSLWRGRAIWTL